VQAVLEVAAVRGVEPLYGIPSSRQLLEQGKTERAPRSQVLL
jgi:hypothetical protein